MKLKIFLADDHAVLRSGLRLLLSAQPDMEVVGEAANGDEAEEQIPSTKPDVVLLDITIPPRGGAAILESILHVRPGLRVIMLTMHNDPAYVGPMLKMGAVGYVAKQAADTELLAAIRAVVQGRTYVDVCGHTGTYDQNAFLAPFVHPEEAGRLGDRLSPREWKVFVFVAQGYTNQQVAGHLALSVKTVETYRARVMEKLGLSNRAELVRYALNMGILHDPTSFPH